MPDDQNQKAENPEADLSKFFEAPPAAGAAQTPAAPAQDAVAESLPAKAGFSFPKLFSGGSSSTRNRNLILLVIGNIIIIFLIWALFGPDKLRQAGPIIENPGTNQPGVPGLPK